MTVALIFFSVACLIRILAGREQGHKGVALGAVFVIAFAYTRTLTDRTGGLALACMGVILLAGLIRPRIEIQNRHAPIVLALAILYFAELGFPALFGESPFVPVFVRISALSLLALMVATRFAGADYKVFLQFILFNVVVQTVAVIYEIVRKTPYWGYSLNRDGTAAFTQENTVIPVPWVRVEGLAGHSIVLGLCAGLALCVLVQLPLKRLWLRILLTGLSVSLLLLSGSRSIIMATVLGCVLHFWYRTAGRSILLRIILVLGGLVGVAYIGKELAPLVRDLLTTGSFTNRFGAIQSIGNLLAREGTEKWLGSGFNQFDVLFDLGLLEQSTIFRVIDNQFVSTLGTNGIIGLALFVLLIVVAFRLASKSVRIFLMVFIVMCFSFDLLYWYSSCITLMGFLGASSLKNPTNTTNSSLLKG